MIKPPFAHLLALSDGIGIHEHAEYTTPRSEHGYCTDDVARLLVVIAREPHPDRSVQDLGGRALRFLEEAQRADGKIQNRRTVTGQWQGEHTVEDCWGRSIWAFGTAFRETPEAELNGRLLSLFEIGVQQRSPWPRAMAFAALGATEVLRTQPGHLGARSLLDDAVSLIGQPGTEPAWVWPEARLHYANAVFPEVLIGAGRILGRPQVLRDGLNMLRWLLDRETLNGHLSVTPVDGAGPGDVAPGFDQQPIEVAAMADACHRAFVETDDRDWLSGVHLAARWFAGDNDSGAMMWDPGSGGGYDGLHPWGPNLNQGAESTLALVSVLQLARRVASAEVRAGDLPGDSCRGQLA